jgi:DNA-binding transcriptional LysR family regulator
MGATTLGHLAIHWALVRQPGIRTAILTSQVRQLETAVGTALLRTGPDGRLTLTSYGQFFARDVAPVLKMLSSGSARKK